jgi:prepilin signal peptidase PulO-like enzyme (type II secretory pathway)
MSVLEMFFLYALPLSAIAPLMIYYAGVTYQAGLLPVLTASQLETIGVVFFLAEVIMVFLVAAVIQRLGEVIDIEPTYEDAFKLAVVAPVPLWLAPLFLLIPSFTLNLAVGALALAASGVLIFRAVPEIFKIEERGRAMLLSAFILLAGMVAWAALMYLTLLTWNAVTSTLAL